jgi:hypothetical protein
LEIEQRPPNQPNFLLIVLLFLAAIVVILVLAYLFLDFEGGHIHLRHRQSGYASQLSLPNSAGPQPHILEGGVSDVR